MKKMYGIFAMAAATLLFVTACTPEATTGMSDRDEAFTLSAPSGLNAQVGHGYVYLTWNNVDNAQQYAIYRRNPNGSRNLLGIVDAYDAPYVSRAAIIGGANTYLDYLNLDNTYTEAGTYYYSVQAQRRDEEDTNTDTNDLNYADSVNSAELAVAITTVPAKGSLLPAVENLSVTYYGEAGDLGVNISWDDLDSAEYYYVHAYEQANEDYLYGLYHDNATTGSFILRASENTILSFGDSQEIRQTSVFFDGDYSDYYFAVEAFPRDDYYYPNGGIMAFQDIHEATLGMITDLAATRTHETEIILEFNAVQGADSYEIWRSNIGYSGWTQLTTVETDFEDVTSDVSRKRYHDTYELEQGIGAERKYWYRVRAVAGTGDTAELSYFSNIAYGSIPALDGGDSLGEIVNLEATDGEFSNKIELTWTAVEDAELYTIYRSEDNAVTYNVLTGANRISVNDLEYDQGTLLYIDDDVVAGDNIDGTKYYWYKVVAIDTNWGIDGDKEVHSPFSLENRGNVSPNTVIAVTPDAFIATPAITYYRQGLDNSITIQWQAVEADADTGAIAATRYEMYYSTAPTGEYTRVATITGTTVTHDTGFAGSTISTANVDVGYDYSMLMTTAGIGFDRGVRYYFRMKAVNDTASAGTEYYSVLSSAAENWLDDLDPATFSVLDWENPTQVLNGTITLRLAELVTGATSYAIYIGADGADFSIPANRAYTVNVTPAILADLLSDDGYDYTGIEAGVLADGANDVALYAVGDGTTVGPEESIAIQGFTVTNPAP